MYKITRYNGNFEYSHLLDLDYPSKCSNVHGHSGKFNITLYADKLDSNYMIFDFKILSEIVKEIEDKFDHSLIISKLFYEKYKFDDLIVNKSKLVVIDHNPTAEYLATLIADYIKLKLEEKKIVSITKLVVEFFETENNSASVMITL